ncbi:hypothetical protein IQ782_21170 [Salipiger pacificus]|uniref:Uncharacterized protein n=1 Tax=Salipiger mangrovisoli TaxID=2865933 RepID=A0ABR9X6Z1_9RHOB|nr:hypothetical protein [Salipiger mangrovisoli]
MFRLRSKPKVRALVALASKLRSSDEVRRSNPSMSLLAYPNVAAALYSAAEVIAGRQATENARAETILIVI